MAHPLNTYSDAVERLLRAAEAMNNAFGGDVPAWLRDEAGTLADACRDMRRAAIPLDRYITPGPAPVRVVLDLTGGVLQGASINGGALDLLAVDYSGDGDAVRMVPQIGTTSVPGETVVLGAYAVQPAWVETMFANHEAAHADEERG